MFQHLISYFQFGNHFCGIEHTLKDNQEILFTTVLKKNKKEVDIESCFSSKTIKETTNRLRKKQHVFLVINDEQVLTKSSKSEQIDGLNLVNKAFPNINISEFYYEIIHQNDINFISICRKKYVDRLIKEYHDSNIHIISFSLGNSIMSNTTRYIDDTSIFTSNARISTQDNFIKTIDYVEKGKEKEYSINGLKVSSAHILSLSSALSSILNNFAPIINYQDKNVTLLDTYKQVRFLGQFIKIGLISILGILLINFLFFNFYFNQVSALNQTSQLNQTTKSNIIKLSEQVSKAQKTTEDLLKGSTSKSSFYIDAIVYTLPKSVLLSEINYQPLEKRIKDDNPILLKDDIIIISGKSNNSSQYSEWIITLESLSWIDKVSVEAYNDSKTSSSNFSIKINIAS